MALGAILFLISLVILILGIALILVSIVFFKKNKNIFAIFSLAIGLFLITPVVFLIFNNRRVNQHIELTEISFIKEYTNLDKEFNEIFFSGFDITSRFGISIEGKINGKAKIFIIPKSYEEEIIEQYFEDEIDWGFFTTNWNASETIIQFIPETEFLAGKILLEVRFYGHNL